MPPRKNRGKAGFWHRRGFAEKELLRECREIATQFLRWRNYLRTSELARPSDSERFVTEGLDDADIVSGLRAGDQDAWGALCQKYGERLWRYVARLVGSDEDGVAEVFQETLMAVARSGRAIRPDTTIWSWLCRIGHNQAALFWRKRYRDKPADHDAVNSLTAADGDPVASLTQRETVESVRGLLAEMNAEHVALLTAKYFDGLTVPQILEAFGGTIEGIRSSLARARRDFRERYDRLRVKQ